MGRLLAARTKVLIFPAAITLAVLAAGLWFLPPPAVDETAVRREMERTLAYAGDRFAGKLRLRQNRAASLARLHGQRPLRPGDLREGEALFWEREGVITATVGEIYFFKIGAENPATGWALLGKGDQLFLQVRTAAHQYYVGRLFSLQERPIRRHFDRFGGELDLILRPPGSAASPSQFDTAPGGVFRLEGPLQGSTGQLIVRWAIRGSDWQDELRRKRRRAVPWLLLLAALGFAGAGPRRRSLLAPPATLAGVLTLAVRHAPTDLAIVLPGGVFLRSTLYPLLAVTTLLFLLAWGRRKLWPLPHFPGIVLFFLLSGVAALCARVLITGAVFPFEASPFSPSALMLLMTLSGLFLLPLLLLEQARKPDGRWRWTWLPAGILFLLWFHTQAGLSALAALPWVCLPPLTMIRPAPWPRRLLFAVAAALLITVPGTRWQALALEDYLTHHLRYLMTSQSHYAKLMAREIVYDFNSSQVPLETYFQPGAEPLLAAIWRNSLVAREGMAMGIHAISPEGRPLASFSHQIPYLDVPPPTDLFPFWHVEEVPADLFGRNFLVALASIQVFAGERLLGTLQIQVLDTPSLLLGESGRAPSAPRFSGSDLGYVVFDGKQQILENPDNISLLNLPALLQSKNRWITFSQLGTRYRGIVFSTPTQVSLLFHRHPALFTLVSRTIRALLAMLVLLLLVYGSEIARLQWRGFFRSYSAKVFALLTALVIATAGLFAVVSVNYNRRELDRQLGETMLEKGRTARGLLENLRAQSGEITQTNLYWLAGVLNTRIHLYEKGILTLTSDNRALLRSEIPIHLHSGILEALVRNRQPFEITPRGGRLHSTFALTPETVVDLDTPEQSLERDRISSDYADFMLTLFFLLLAAGTGSAVFFRKRLLAPIHAVNDRMSAVERGDLSPFPTIPRDIEWRELVEGFNAMIHGIAEQQKSVREIARMKTVIQLGRRVAHEVKNPLTPIRLSAEQIGHLLRAEKHSEGEQIAQAVRFIIEETDHLQKVAHGFLDLARLDEIHAESFDLAAMVREELAGLSPLHPGLRFVASGTGHPLPVSADRLKIRQALKNLLLNAVEALNPAGGEISVQLASEQGRHRITVTDSGPGFSPGLLETLLESPASTREGGSGLGLFITRRIAELHHGTLVLANGDAGGGKVSMEWEDV